MIPSFDKLQVGDDDLNRVQDRIKATLGALVQVPLFDGVLIENLELTSGAFTPVPHKLARPWRGYIVVSKTANAQLWNRAPAEDAALFLHLQPSASVTVSVWVF